MLIALFVAAGAGFAASRGQDTNYDQFNYHYYSAYAFETDRLLQDVAPAQVMHSFFSPIVYLPFYAMVRHLPPRAVGTILGAAQGLTLWLVVCIAMVVTRRLPRAPRVAAVIAALVISAAGPMALSEVGTTMADLLTGIPVLAGLALLMRSASDDGRRLPAMGWIALGGAMVGAAVSLKLTNASFAIALAAASPIGWAGWRDRLTAVLATAIGGIVGFAAIGGFWYVEMWRLFRNPVFPYFNTVFASPDYPAGQALADTRFIPHGLLQALLYPLRWAQAQTTTAEIAFRDIRFALLMILAGLALCAWPIRRGGARERMRPADKRLIVFFVVALCIWMYVWSIQRYLVVLELLAGPAVVVLLHRLGAFRSARVGAAVACGLAVACAVTVKVPDWGHLGWRQNWYGVEVPPTEGEHPLYLLAGEPLSYVVPALKPGASVIGYVPWENIPAWGDTVFLRRIHQLVGDPRNDPVLSVSSGPPSDGFKQAIAQYGLSFDGACETTPGRPWPLTWCALSRTPPAR